MALNRRLDHGNHLPAIAVPVGTLSGDTVLIGPTLVGVASTDRTEDGLATVELDGSWDFTVKAIDGAGNSAIAVGDHIYRVDADTPKLSKKNTGVFVGTALTALASGATGTVEVLLRAK
jgi:hypothetical protein